jgi:hypothetical protein
MNFFLRAAGNTVAVFFSSAGEILLDVPRYYGDPEIYPEPIAGDIYINTTGALKTVTSKILHKDVFAPIFTSDPGVDIYIVEDNLGTLRAYDRYEPLPEYVEGETNQIHIVRDNTDVAATEIYIVITQP